MAIAYTHETSDVPGGLVKYGEYHYAYHPTGLANLWIWYPRDGAGNPVPFVNAPVMLYNPGGNYHNPTQKAHQITPQGFGSGATLLAETLNDSSLTSEPWVIVVVRVPQSPSTSSQLLDLVPVAMWPEPELYLRWSFAHLRDNYSGKLVGSNSGAIVLPETQFGAELWNAGYGFTADGQGNTIDRGRIYGLGISASATNLLFNQYLPDDQAPAFSGVSPMTNDAKVPRSSGRPSGVIASIGQVDWSQLNSAGQLGSTGQHQHWMRRRSQRQMDALDRRYLRAASPYDLLTAGYPLNKVSAPVWCSWPHASGSEGSALVPADFQPGRILDDVANNKSLQDPHHHYWSRPFAQAVQTYGDPRSRIYWGNSSSHDGGGPDVDKGPSEFVDATFVASVVSFLEGTGAI